MTPWLAIIGVGAAGVAALPPEARTALDGAATVLGPFLGTLFMYYVVDITSNYTTAYLLFVGVALILLVLYFPKGVLGTVRERWLPWLP